MDSNILSVKYNLLNMSDSSEKFVKLKKQKTFLNHSQQFQCEMPFRILLLCIFQCSYLVKRNIYFVQNFDILWKPRYG
jgi:hypothetical protein